MGYDAKWSGEITITPPILATLPVDHYRTQFQDIALRIVEAPVGGEPGVFRRVIDAALPDVARLRPAVGHVRRTAPSGYWIVEELQALVDQWPHHEFTGHLQARGPDGNPWRVTVIDRVVVQVYRVVVWPYDEALVDQLDEMLQPELAAVALGLSNARDVARAVLATICKAGGANQAAWRAVARLEALAEVVMQPSQRGPGMVLTIDEVPS